MNAEELIEILNMYFDDDDTSTTIIRGGSPEGDDIEVFYKGRKVTNAKELRLHGAGFQFEKDEKITNWKKYLATH